MGFIREIRVCYKALFAIIVCFWVSGSIGEDIGYDEWSYYKLYRGERDILTCHDDKGKSECTQQQCENYNAVRLNQTYSGYCRCQSKRNTFIYKTDLRGKIKEARCKSDEEIVLESGICSLYVSYKPINCKHFNLNTS